MNVKLCQKKRVLVGRVSLTAATGRLVMLVAVLAVTQAFAQFEGVIEMKGTVSSAAEAKSTVTISLSKMGSRVEQHIQTPSSELAFIAFTRADTPNTVCRVNDRNKTCEVTLLPNAEKTGGVKKLPNYTVKELGQEKILGYDTRHVQIKHANFTMEVWTTKELGSCAAYGAAQPRSDDEIVNALQEVMAGGLFLRFITTMVENRKKYIMKMEAVKIEAKALPPSTFAPPVGYEMHCSAVVFSKKKSLDMGKCPDEEIRPVDGMKELQNTKCVCASSAVKDARTDARGRILSREKPLTPELAENLCPLRNPLDHGKEMPGAAWVVRQEVGDGLSLLPPWQSFKSPIDGTMTDIEVRPNFYGGVSGKLSIYEGEGVSGMLLCSQDYTSPSISDCAWRTFTLETPLPVAKGKSCTWELTGAHGLMYAKKDCYPGGRSSQVGYDMCFRVRVAPSLSKESLPPSDFTYEVHYGGTNPISFTGYTLTGYTGAGGTVTIPDVIAALPVTRIGIQAFKFCTNLTSVAIPASVVSIGDYAFHRCQDLASVTIGKNVTNVGTFAFSTCANLSELIVDEHNPAFSCIDGVLFDKNKTTLLKCPRGKVGHYTVPSGVIRIGENAFSDCVNLTGVTMPPSIVNIERGAFHGCAGLTSIQIPDCVRSIEEGAFGYCNNLTNAMLGNNVTNIGYVAFEACTSMTNVTIPASVVSLGEGAFMCCTSLTNMTIGSSVNCIANYAFLACTNLCSVTVPDSVKLLGEGAFSSCSKLNSVFFKGNAPAFVKGTEKMSVNFNGNSSGPKSVAEIFEESDRATVYYLQGSSGWGATFGGRPTALWNP